jgi:hypothetical protein
MKVGEEEGSKPRSCFQEGNNAHSTLNIVAAVNSQGFPLVIPITSSAHQPPEMTEAL